MARVDDTGIIIPTDDDSTSSVWEQWQQNYILGQAAIEELALLKPILALAISKLSNDKKQLKITLSDQAKLGTEWALQMKRESQSGAIVFRAVRA